MKNYDLNKWKKPEKKFLKLEDSSKSDHPSKETATTRKDKVVKHEIAKKNEKIGRPTIGDEPISKRFSLAFTETEYNTLKENAGKVPLASFIRDVLKVAKVI